MTGSSERSRIDKNKLKKINQLMENALKHGRFQIIPELPETHSVAADAPSTLSKKVWRISAPHIC